MNWKRYDVYSKTIEGIQEKTFSGGILTLISIIIVTILLFSELMVYCTTQVVNRMSVDTSPLDTNLDIKLDIRFLHEQCDQIEMYIRDTKGNKDIVIENNVHVEPYKTEGCRIYGDLTIQKVPGDINFMHKGYFNLFNMMDFLMFNSSHYIKHLTFGPSIPSMVNPLNNVQKIVMQNAALYKYFVNIVPSTYVSKYKYATKTYQYSATEHARPSASAHGISLPGVSFAYEFSPIRVEYIETKPSFLQFLTSISAIVGGVLAVLNMIDGAIYRVASKKVE